jgi:cobalt-zinc-cadmium efflux system outer membrane protein
MSIHLRAAFVAAALLASASTAQAGPVTLADALAQGSTASPRIEQARAQLAAAEGRARQAGVSPNPEIGLEVENFVGTGPFRGLRASETTLALSQRFELGGKRDARVAVARAELGFATLALTRAEADLARDIRTAHADLRAAEDRAVLARDNVGRAQELARTSGILVDAGRDPPLRRLRADALLAEARAEEARTFGLLLAARRLLASLIGSDDAELSASDATDPATPAALPAGEASLDERLAIAERDAAQARIRVAQSSAVPDLTASGGLRRFGEGGETALVAGISLPLPIRDRNRGGIAAARSDTLAAEANLAQTRLDAVRTRRDAAVALEAADARLAALSGPGAAQSEEALRLAQVGYAAGRFSLVELIDAQTALNSARLALIDARLDRARALAALARANAQ